MWQRFFVGILLSVSLLTWGLEAKVILITGASGDIGLGIARDALQKGDTVIGQYSKNKDKLEALSKEFQGKAFLIQADFNKPETVANFWKAVLEIKQKIDVVVNSAGIEKDDTEFVVVQEIMNINYFSPYLLCEAAIGYFKENKISGIIINIGSRAAFRGLPKGGYTYAASKAALTRYSYDIARDNAKDGISVFVVAPGPVEGQMLQGVSEDMRNKCVASMQTGKVVQVAEVVAAVDLYASGKVPNGTGGTFDLMGASWGH